MHLVVYDCYRPACGHAAFVAWSQDGADEIKKAEYYPNIDKKDLFDLGYIARQSTHTTGLAVDLAFDGFDFGTPFDLFDERSATADPAVHGAARKNRDRLLTLMTKHGFRKPAERMVHFTYKGVSDPEPVDFDVTRD